MFNLNEIRLYSNDQGSKPKVLFYNSDVWKRKMLLTKLWKFKANRPLLAEYRAQQLDSLKKINRKWEIEFSEEGVLVSIDERG